MRLNIAKYKLNKKQLKRFFIYSSALTIIMMAMLAYLYNLQVKQDRANATAVGEGIVSSICTELRRCYDTTELMADLYNVNSTIFLNSFGDICKELHEDNLAIGSMYWAPNAVIQYAYPQQVDEATLNFEMLKDPTQGPKAQKAIDSRVATIAGPHSLIEGGKGFIIRNPHFDAKGNFTAFAIMVIDTKQFLEQVVRNLKNDEINYRFSIWKTDDPTAIYDEGGYILSSDNPIAERIITIPFTAPNDEWYLTLEPLEGWTPLANMLSTLIVAFIIFIFAIGSIYGMLHGYQMREEIQKAEKEQERMKEIERYQQELMAARDAAQAANAAKSAFFFNMSHDIRTPMNAIIGYTNLMIKEFDDKEMCRVRLAKVHSACQFLLGLINNVLEMARIESGKETLNEEPSNLPEIAQDIADLYIERSKLNGIEFTTAHNVTHPFLHIDQLKIKQILMNLISNAFHYTTKGGSINVSIREVECERPGYATIQTIITDTGIGISKEFLPHLFDEYAREQNDATSKHTGTGLGLNIVKRLVELMGGTIEAQSEVGKGTSFTVTISHPIAEEILLQEKAAREISSDRFKGKRILLAEDNEINAEISTAILTSAGFKVDHVEDGILCVDKYLKSPTGYYDVILMDIQMPNLNGYDATRRIRQISDAQKAKIPIIALTANAFNKDREDSLAAGMNAHLAKPIEVDKLIETLSEVL